MHRGNAQRMRQLFNVPATLLGVATIAQLNPKSEQSWTSPTKSFLQSSMPETQSRGARASQEAKKQKQRLKAKSLD